MILIGLALVASLDSAVVHHVEVAPGEILHTTVIGSGEPVVLIPGIFGGAYGYRKVTGPLVQRGYRCIVIEPLGYGRSSHPPKADYSFTAQTQRISKALEQLGITEALFIANSTGASIALRLAIANPEHGPRHPLHRWWTRRERGDARNEEGVADGQLYYEAGRQ